MRSLSASPYNETHLVTAFKNRVEFNDMLSTGLNKRASIEAQDVHSLVWEDFEASQGKNG